MEILSVNNPRVKQWSQLLNKKGRDQSGLFLLEGIHLTLEALNSDAELQTILYSLERDLPAELQAYVEQPGSMVEWIGVSEAILSKCTETPAPQGVVGICKKLGTTAEELLRDPEALLVALDGVQDPGNLGTIIRSADAVGATGVLLGRGTVDLYNPKTIRSTMGSLFHIPVVACDLLEVMPEAKAAGVQLVGTRLDAPRNCYELDLRKPTLLLMGSEGGGLSAEIEDYVDTDVIIPMRGKAESLNVAMATSVLLYEGMRQRYYSSL